MLRQPIIFSESDDLRYWNGELSRWGLSNTVYRIIANEHRLNSEIWLGFIVTPTGKVQVYRHNDATVWFISSGLYLQEVAA